MPPEPGLRPVTAGDVDWIMAQEVRTDLAPFIGHWPRERHLANLESSDKRYLIAERDGARVGFVILAGLASAERVLELARIAVTRPGRGLGRPILRQVLAMAFDELAASRLWLDVYDDNRRAIRAYEAVGFRDDGRRKPELKADGSLGQLIFMSIRRPSSQSGTKRKF